MLVRFMHNSPIQLSVTTSQGILAAEIQHDQGLLMDSVLHDISIFFYINVS